MERDRTEPPSSRGGAWLWLPLGALLLLLSTGRFSVPLAAWLAPVFLIRFFRRRRVLVGSLLILLGLWVAYAISWRAILSFAPFDQLPFFLILALLMAVNGYLPLLADRLLAPRLKGLPGSLVFPLAMTATWLLYNLASPIGGFGTLGYEQYPNLALTQLASLTGLWGITFLVSWFGALANWAWERSFRWPEVRGGALLYGVILGAVLLYGGLRLALAEPLPGTVRIHGVSQPEEVYDRLRALPAGDREALRGGRLQLSEAFLEATVREARRGAQIVLWPEMAAGGEEQDAQETLARAKQVAAQEGIYLALGLMIEFPGTDRLTENRLIVVDPSGEVVIDHVKYGGVLLDGKLPGDRILRLAETPYGTLSGIVCYDGDYPLVVGQAGRRGVDILLIAHGEPNRAVARLHVAQHVFRAIENGVSLFRQDATKGFSFATDPYGRILASVDSLTTSERLTVAQVPTHGVRTVYAVIGDLFGWASVAGFVGLAIWAVVAGRRRGA
ncbi:MAG: hypothetical protein GX657_04390 [Chloroflexi bacterium]|nr:hypothetical protein [Chloroflexota bacterium]